MESDHRTIGLEVLREVRAKQAELGPDELLETVLLELVREAIHIWEKLSRLIAVDMGYDCAASSVLYLNRSFLKSGFVRPDFDEFARIIGRLEEFAAAENLLRYIEQIDTAKLNINVRRMRVVTEEFPNLIRSVSQRGIGSHPQSLWEVLWRLALRQPPEKIAEQLRTPLPNGQRGHAESRATIFRRREAVNQDIAVFLKPHLPPTSAA
jgi:hypothetical protein